MKGIAKTVVFTIFAFAWTSSIAFAEGFAKSDSFGNFVMYGIPLLSALAFGALYLFSISLFFKSPLRNWADEHKGMAAMFKVFVIPLAISVYFLAVILIKALAVIFFIIWIMVSGNFRMT